MVEAGEQDPLAGMPTGPEVEALSRLYALVYVCEDGAFYQDYDRSMDILDEAKNALGTLAEYFYGKPPAPVELGRTPAP